MAHVEGGHIEAEVERGGPDQQVLEGDGNAPGGLFAFDPSGKLRDLERDGVDDHIQA